MNNLKNIAIIILIFFAILGLYFIIPKAQTAIVTYNDVTAKTQTVEEAKKQIEDLKAQKDTYEQEVKVSTKPVYKNDIEATDQLSSFGVMFEDVIQSAKYNGLKLRSIAYNTAPSGDVVQTNISADYNVCAITMQLIGSYMQFRSYFQDLYNYPYLINLDKISVNPYEDNKRILIADVTVILYSTKNAAQKAAATAVQAEPEDQKLDGATGITPGM